MSLLDWLDHPPDGKGMRVLDPRDNSWRFHSYAELGQLTRQGATRLRRAGVGAGDAITIVRAASPEFVADFFGALLVGATPSVAAPPVAFRNGEAYRDHLSRLVRLVGARAVSTSVQDAPIVTAAVGHACVVLTDIDPDLELSGAAPDLPPIGLIQFSSGSMGPPRAVRIPLDALQANVSAMAEWLLIGAADGYASWLPLHHDMGLIGLLLLPMNGGNDLWMMRPEDFVRSPVRWLRCFADGGATTSASPSFGLAQVISRVRAEQLQGLDLSGWRRVIVAAERIDNNVLDRFKNLLAPYGLPGTVVVPAYGLAESTVAVTGGRCGAEIGAVTIDASALSLGQKVVPVTDLGRGTTLVSCGRPLRGVAVRVLDEEGEPVAEDVLGEIEVAGTSLAAGRISEDGDPEPFTGSLLTGDAGFVHGGELYVVGRLGDGVKQLGRWLFAEDVEHIAIARSPRPHKTVAVIGALDGRNTVAVVVEGGIEGGVVPIGRAVARQHLDLRVLVLDAAAGTILRTTSGKPRRRAMWQRLAGGELDDMIVWDSDTDTARPTGGS